MRIVFMGTPQFAVPSLRALNESDHELVACVTVPDKPAGRSLTVRSSPVKVTAEELELPLLQPQGLSDRTFIDQLRSYSPDLAVVVAFRILPAEVFTVPGLGCINLHASLLPELRGAAPINWAIMRGMTVTGLTTFLIEKRVDTGNILLQTTVPIEPADDAGTLAEKMSESGAELVLRTVDEYGSDRISPQPQTGTPTQAPKIKPEHCLIDWKKPAEEIHNQIRGLSPSPSAFTTLNNKRVKIFRSRVRSSESKAEPGLIQPSTDLIQISTGKGVLTLLELQIEGKKRMSVGDFLRGYSIQPGTRFV